MKNKIYSLKKIVDFLFVIIILLFLVYVIFDVRNIQNTLYKVETEKIETTLNNELNTINPMLKFGFYDSLKQELNNLLKEKSVLLIELKSKNFNFKKQKLKPKYLLIKKLIYKNEELGFIKIGYTDDFLIKTFFKKYFVKFIIYLAIVLPVLLYIFMFLRKKISKLNTLANVVKNINFKKHSKIELIGNYFEIINITNAINRLLNQINTFYLNQLKLIRKLTSYKKYLESSQKIAEMFSWQYDCENKTFSSQNIKKISNLEIQDINEFINSIINKKDFLNKIDYICRHNEELEDIFTIVNKQNKKMYFKIFAKHFKQKDKDIIIGSALNITEEIKKQEKIEYLAYHDVLTGLPNRALLKKELKTIMAFHKRHKKKFAFMFLDIDNFKMINDNFGHERGDKLIKEIAKRLTNILRESDLVARVGGDEFVIVITEIKNKEDCLVVYDKLKKVLTKPIKILDDVDVSVTFSLGISIFPDDTEDIEELFQYSDIAMYNAKNNGKDQYSFITEELKKQIKEYYEIVEEIKEALKKDNELILYFQPKINIHENKIEGCEALIRWKHHLKGMIPPGKFIPYVEKGGLSTKLDSYVLQKAVETLSKWQTNKKLKDLVIAINITAGKFKEENFVDELKSLINKYKINPTKLQIEITESIGIKHIDYTIATLKQIKELDIQIAIDDFGTGYSSLNYIKDIPFDVLKIDQSFIKDLFKDSSNKFITQMIIQIAKVLNKITIAEGVEDEKTLKEVKEMGVDIVQGYYFSKPLDEKKFIDYVYNFEKTQ